MTSKPALQEEEAATNDASKGRILIVDDEPSARQTLGLLLEGEGYEVKTAPDGFKALGVLQQWPCDLLLTDLRMPVMDGLTLIQKVREQEPDLDCIVMTAFGTVENAVDAMKSGASDYLTKPLNFDAVEMVIDRAFERLAMRRELHALRQRTHQHRPRTRMLGNSAPMQDLKRLIEQVSTSRATVMVTGESGTGKELVARLIHETSERANKPFVRLHCAALSDNLLESELFGHERGSFTGAIARREGRFEQAHGGTLFLDEIGEIPHTTQVKLLRFLQQREFERVGSNKTITVDVRVIAATNRDLIEEVKEGHFREDLYYRLNVVALNLPPLRERDEDITLIAQYRLGRYTEDFKVGRKTLGKNALIAIRKYAWPGNIRQMENRIKKAVILSDNTVLEPEDLDLQPEDLEDILPLNEAKDRFQRRYINEILARNNGNRTKTARDLGVDPRTIFRHLEKESS